MKAAPPPPPPEIPCPCGLPAPRVVVGCGVDLHHCACGAWLDRWWCCGAVSERGEDAGYRSAGICPGCGRSRWRESPARMVLAGGVRLEDMAARARAEDAESEEETCG